MDQRGMQRKTIKRTLIQKLEEWVGSIDDSYLVSLIKKDTIVTGGSIASMLLGEKVNDYDIYFKTLETTQRVAEYYVAKFNAAKVIKSEGTLSDHTPVVCRDVIKNIKGYEEDRICIKIKSAGVAHEEMSEYKYFETRPEEEQQDFMESLGALESSEDKPKYRPVFLSQNAITLSDRMQIVIRFHGLPSQIHDNYDFVHAMSYFDWDTKELVIPAAAMESMMSKTLYYHGSLYPLCSIFRAKKFIERGWHISAGQLLKIMWQISEVDLKDRLVMQEQLIGVDAAYMHMLFQALQDVDPQKINSTYVGEIIDRIF